MEGVIYHVYHSHDSLDKRANMTQQIPEEKMNRKLVYTNYLHFFIFIDNKRLLVSIASALGVKLLFYNCHLEY